MTTAKPVLKIVTRKDRRRSHYGNIDMIYMSAAARTHAVRCPPATELPRLLAKLRKEMKGKL